MSAQKCKKEWFEDEDFWLNYAPVMFDQNLWAQAHGIAESVMNIAGLKEGDSVMDVCSGPGRISVEMACLGLKVTAIDITQPYLDIAKETAEDEGVELETINHDMRTFSSEKKYDAAVNLYNSFGYCDSISDDTKIIKSTYNALKDGGIFIMELISRETAVKYFTEGEWYERDNLTILTEFSVEGLWEGLRSKWIIIDENGKKLSHEFVQRLYSAKELRDTFLEVGFSDVKVYGGYDLRPYDQNASTMVIVAKK